MTSIASEAASLLCDEVLDMTELTRTPPDKIVRTHLSEPASTTRLGGDFEPTAVPLTVKALHDEGQIRDPRVLQNLLRNEEKYIPAVPDFLHEVQRDCITPEMRRLVAEWMLEVVHEQNSQPDVFALAVNVMDRFLCQCPVRKSQLQLVGSVCILIASKIREPCPIPGQTLIVYTDYSITSEELKVRENNFGFFYRLQKL